MNITPFGLIVTVVIMAMMGSVGYMNAGALPFGLSQTERALKATLEGAKTLAASTNCGATVEVTPTTGGGSELSVFACRPYAGYTYGSTPESPPAVVDAPLSVGTATSFAILISSNKAVTVQSPYAHGATIAEPACSTSFAVIDGWSDRKESFTVSCLDGGVTP